ncbi:tetratricopeptide repeat protein [Kordiimonas gwangyangensis]|uniref:tetratricopeptide repeat protein n=1 Tax=Kordiimonas gwangyangensis TaxID=288022 RepID=UPI00138AB161|nr:tetratricopeptide repeat protein [Kordiimonas gwangyangensis]
MNRMYALIGIGLIGAGFTAAQADPTTYHLSQDRYIASGNAALEEGRLEDALTSFRKAVKKNITARERTVTLNSICAVENILGNAEAAVEACDAAIAADDGYWKAYVNRGNARAALGNHEGAIEDYCRANDISPSQVSGTFEARCNAQS